jgi:hypothetical protein
MSPELAARHLALEALADPITPLPAVTPAKRRIGAVWRPRLDAVDLPRGLVMAVAVLVLRPLLLRFAPVKQRRKD